MLSPAMHAPAHPVPSGYLAELRGHLAAMIADFRRLRNFGAILKTEVAEDITADAAAEQGRVGRLAYTAEQSDLEAARLLRETLADGHLAAEEIPALRLALRHVNRSAARDHQITETLA